ncbi:MAG: TonB-dependent receptor plug domain-containing protein [Bacteroidales bacterium]
MNLKFNFIIIILICSFQISYSQKSNDRRIFISGIITDSNHQPIEGAFIFIDDKNTNATTNSKGYYKVKVNSGSQKISALSVLGGTSESTINGRTEINFVMETDSSEAGMREPEKEVPETVSDGYSTINKRNSATSSSKINAQNQKYKSYQNIYEMIRGEVSGVRVIGSRIQIMGPSSIGGNDDPLFIVDGIPVDKIDNISPAQVRSIEVLKGADTAIYGTRSANGVLIIKLISAGDRSKN